MTSFLSRLRERKLAQWALAYLAGAWLIFEATEVLAGPWNLSPTFQRGVHLLLGIGFFIILVLAWYHGEKGRQRVSGPALAAAGRALQLDPLSVVINQNLGEVLMWAGLYEAAISQLERTLDLSSDFPPTWAWLAESLLRVRRFDEARDALARNFELTGSAPETAHRLVDLVVEYDSTGRPSTITPDLEAALSARPRLFDFYSLAGQRERTLDALELAYEQRDSGILLLKDPAYDFLRDDPRFIELMRNVNLSP